MKRSGLPPIAWALTGLLLVAAFMISLGQQDNASNPEVASYGPSGLSAFADLLRNSGINVVVDQNPRPKLSPNDVAVLFQIVKPTLHVTGLGGDDEKDYRDQFLDSVKNGASGVIIPLNADYLVASRGTANRSPAVVQNVFTGQTFHVTTTADQASPFDELDSTEDAVGLTIWSEGSPNGAPADPSINAQAGTPFSAHMEKPFLRSYRMGKGTVLAVRDGIGVTNRFVDKADNATAFASALKVLAGSGKRIVFEEASFGNVHEPTLLGTIGPWASAAWTQILFLALVILFTLGKRFGIAESFRTPQRGARELLDGMADTFKRARSTNVALATAWTRADSDIRRLLKLPRDATRSERDRLLPVGLQNAMARLEAASQMTNVGQEDALDLVKHVQVEMDAFLGPHRARMRSQAKLTA